MFEARHLERASLLCQPRRLDCVMSNATAAQLKGVTQRRWWEMHVIWTLCTLPLAR